MGAVTGVPAAISGGAPRTLTPWLKDAWSGASAIAPCLGSLAGVAACTWIGFHFGLSLGSAGFLFLAFVVLAAFYGGFWQATVVSVVAVASLDYFFEDPIFSFRVDLLSDWVELFVFEFTALVISQLSNRVQLRAQEAVAERRDTDRLCQAAHRILLLESPSDLGNQVPLLIRELFDLRGVLLFDGLSETSFESGELTSEADRYTKQAFSLNSVMFDPQAKSWYCVLHVAGRPVGALALCGGEMRRLTVTALASLVAIAFDRARALEKQYQAEVARQAEQFRTTVLDSLAHQFKTPLAVIRTASSGLPAAGGLSEAQTELVRSIDRDARTLDDLASRLLGAPALPFAAFQQEPEPLLLSRLMKTALQELDQPADRDRFHMNVPVHEPPVFAGRELILTALAQVIDNALKYSLPGSPIDVGFVVQEAALVLAVRSKGLMIPAEDRERIFERFYRADPSRANRADGAGLGLSLVKWAVDQHHGSIDVETQPGRGSTFRVMLPT